MDDEQAFATLRMQDYDSLDSTVKNIITSHEADIAKIDTQIEQLECRVRQLKFQKSQREELVRRCKGMVTLARRIPPEILASIFGLCVDDGWTFTPLLVSHVCSEWRKAATNSAVWSHVYVNLNARDPYGRTKFWLDRAQSSMLRLTIEVRKDSPHLPRVMALLMSRISQWRFLNIKSCSDLHVMQLLSYCRRQAPTLQSISLNVEGEFHTTNNTGIGMFALGVAFPDAPQLRCLRLRRSLLPPPRFIPPSITMLYLDLVTDQPAGIHVVISAIIGLLRALPYLFTFSFTIPGSSTLVEIGNEETMIAYLPHLEHLVLSGPARIFLLLPFLRTSSLKNLHLISPLSFTGHYDDQLGAQLVQFVVVAKPPLQLLELRDVSISTEAYPLLFTHLSELRELRLHESDITDSVLQPLEGLESSCPHLRVLDLRWCNQVTGVALVRLVRSRLTSIPGDDKVVDPISIITVINCAFVGDYDIIELAEMTVCRLIFSDNEEDPCRLIGCCSNGRYRRRLRLLAKLHHVKEKRLVL